MSRGWKITSGIAAALAVIAVSGAAIFLTKAFKELDNLTWPEDLTVEDRERIAKQNQKK